ncbi:tautomerase family protein [Maritalea mediterranea]|uniref:4-oxalocrotonate tautomerase domain-containing protein n=1 Tax=Maritalea mediterranea TaxID=2909667 RepID=A0ABS9E7N5_9HYPH|nr:hypothetical protein [Maritalea mediterranea]MCF4098890.1 hypothetical protein [Maritalea mediterranea]
MNVPEALRRTCIAIAEAYHCPVEYVSATWQEIEPDHYVVGGHGGALQQPAKTHPPVATLLCLEGKDDAAIEATLEAAGRSLSEELGLKDNVFVTYHEVGKGRVFDEGAVYK